MTVAKRKLIERFNIAVEKLNGLEALDGKEKLYDKIPVDYKGKLTIADVEYLEKHFRDMAIMIGRLRAIESKQWNDELLEANWIESSDEYCVHRGSYIVLDGLTEREADDFLDDFQAECDE
jgi:hypothetical protein